MKTLIICLLAALGSIAWSQAQSSPGAGSKPQDPIQFGIQKGYEQALAQNAGIKQVFKDFEKAFRAGDLDGIMAIYDQDVVAYDVAPPLQYVGSAAYRKTWKNFLDSYEGPIDVEFRDLHVVSASGDVAFTYALERFTGKLKSGGTTTVWVRVTDCWMKRNSKSPWRIVHEHVSVPVDLETGKAALELQP
jgi:ketosteroid isomerase-like protein